MTLFFLIVTGVLGLGIGVWLGMRGRYTQTPEDIERVMESGGDRRRKVKRIFTPLAWMQRQISTSGPSADRRRQRGSRSGFKLESPEDRKD
mgnify:CR=1 FL=1